MEKKLEIKNVNYIYSKDTPFATAALRDVSCTFYSDQITGLIGHTGSGKSTLVQMLNGLLRPSSGKVLLDGIDIWEEPKEISRVRFKVGLVFQYPEYQLFEETVFADIAFGPKNMGLDEESVKKRVLMQRLSRELRKNGLINLLLTSRAGRKGASPLPE